MDQPPSILSISYYQSLLQTREWILRRAGFNVVSAQNFAEAMSHCRAGDFDLAILGHAIPSRDQAALISELKRHNHTRVLWLFMPGDSAISEADWTLNSLEDPEKLIETVQAILQKKSPAAEPEPNAKESKTNPAA